MLRQTNKVYQAWCINQDIQQGTYLSGRLDVPIVVTAIVIVIRSLIYYPCYMKGETEVQQALVTLSTAGDPRPRALRR